MYSYNPKVSTRHPCLHSEYSKRSSKVRIYAKTATGSAQIYSPTRVKMLPGPVLYSRSRIYMPNTSATLAAGQRCDMKPAHSRLLCYVGVGVEIVFDACSEGISTSNAIFTWVLASNDGIVRMDSVGGPEASSFLRSRSVCVSIGQCSSSRC